MICCARWAPPRGGSVFFSFSRPCAHSERAIVEETITLNLDVAAMSSSDKPLYGRTMVFLKDVHVVQLHTAVEKKRDLAATCLQSLVRGCMSRFRTRGQKRLVGFGRFHWNLKVVIFQFVKRLTSLVVHT
eukprot:m.238180 g.238180  ORF g.238180 m.238180 type:complete len:130 (-) comp17113_c1_seq40:2346-2735(-)